MCLKLETVISNSYMGKQTKKKTILKRKKKENCVGRKTMSSMYKVKKSKHLFSLLQ